MTAVTGERLILQQEETDFDSAVSENLLTRMAAIANFISTRQYDTHGFHFNRLYRRGVGVVGRDGIFPVLFNMEIVGLTLYNRLVGTSDETEIDIKWLSESGVVEGSIFSTTPKFDVNVGNNAYMIYDVQADTTRAKPALGATEPVFSKTQFSAGEALRSDILGAMVGAEDCSLLIHFRPI